MSGYPATQARDSAHGGRNIRGDLVTYDRSDVIYAVLGTGITLATELVFARKADIRGHLYELWLLPIGLLVPAATQQIEESYGATYSFMDSLFFGAAAATLGMLFKGDFRQSAICFVSGTFGYEAAKYIGETQFDTKDRIKKKFYTQ